MPRQNRIYKNNELYTSIQRILRQSYFNISHLYM